MQPAQLSPLTVVDYHRDILISWIASQAAWGDRPEVATKPQLTYLCNYLEVDHVNAKTMVIEGEYIDRHYAEDYSEYYARCFPQHSRICTRVHFFSRSFNAAEFRKKALESTGTAFLQDAYLGFVVIRPIPHTPFGRICLRRYQHLVEHDEKDDRTRKQDSARLIARVNTVSLFGISLTVETAPLIEQDTVLSACATSALWTLLSVTQQLSQDSLPSPSAVTKAASHPEYDGQRTFPTTGLTPQQVARAIKRFGLEPSIFVLGGSLEARINSLKELVFAYVRNGVPILLGGTVFDGKQGKLRRSGTHLVCALGYQLSKADGNSGLLSHGIEKLFVHDDRFGPYLRISAREQKFRYVDDDGKINWSCGLPLSIYGHEDAHYFVPNIAIIGVYHKIRLTYEHIHRLCEAFEDYLIQTEQLCRTLRKLRSADPAFLDRMADQIRRLLDGSWEVSLTTNSRIKERVRQTNDFKSYRGVTSKTAVLTESMPKYIWRCRIFDNRTHERLTDILFDATEVPQGNVVLGHISYNTDAMDLWTYLEQAAIGGQQDLKSFTHAPLDAWPYISAFMRFFSDKRNNNYLNIMYGPLTLPLRALKDGETKPNAAIARTGWMTKIIRGTSDWDTNQLDKNKRYIWVIDETGDLVIGEDVVDKNNRFEGHPTLINGGPARLGGELLFDLAKKNWTINLKSRTYSSQHSEEPFEKVKGYLEAVAKYNLPGLAVKV